MIFKRELFSVPIYFCSKSDFFERVKQRRKKAEVKAKNSYAGNPFGISPEIPIEKFQWEFDQIIGWIEFYLNDRTIKANFWLVKAKQISINLKRKEFVCLGKLADVSQTHHLKNDEIRSDIKSFLKECQDGKYIDKIKKYHIETSCFLDWIAFLDIKAWVEKINRP